MRHQTNKNFALTSATLKNGEKLYFGDSDIVLIVGPNNSGKSTFLREIRNIAIDSTANTRIFQSIQFSRCSEKELRKRVFSYFHVVSDGTLEFVLDERGDRLFYINDFARSPGQPKLGQAVDAFISFLNSEKRLSLSIDVPTIDLLINKPKHPYHMFMTNPSLLTSFSDKIRQAFGLDFTITRIGNPIRGYVGTNFPISDSVSSDQEIPRIGESLQHQGDGLRSYAGILAEIQTMSHPIVLLDEPEAFLHPPHARRLGRTVISELEENRQAFIATHSSHILQGILNGNTDRVRVIRLDRKNKTLFVKCLENSELVDAVGHPSVANSNLLDSLFYDNTVVCEGDADCKIFDWLHRKWGPDSGPDLFWYSTGGKHQFPKITRLLQSFGVQWRAILDLDALSNWDILFSLAGMKGLDIAPYRKRVTHALRNIQSADLSQLRNSAIQALQADQGDEAALRENARILEGKKLSSALKQYGLQAIRNGQERADIENLLDELNSVGICLLKKGELESYVPSLGTHGPNWVSTVLDNFTDYPSELSDLRRDIATVVEN